MNDPWFADRLRLAKSWLDANFSPPPAPRARSPSPSLDTPPHLELFRMSRLSGPWPNSFLDSINNGLQRAWAPSTLKSYSTGIHSYLAFCRLHQIPSRLVFPTSEELLCAFVASKLELSPATLKNYINGLRAWHLKDNHTFPVSDRVWAILKAPRPPAAVAPVKKPITLPMLELLAANLSQTPFDLAVLACALTAFWGVCRLGELLSVRPPLTPLRIPSLQHLHWRADFVELTLPWTKVSKWVPQTVYLAPQSDPLNPLSALRAHLAANNLSPTDPLFSFRQHGHPQPLTKRLFLSRCNELLSRAGEPAITGHSFRVGGTTHFLLSGIDPDILKVHGRWASDSFLRYWRNLDLVIPARVRFTRPALLPGLARNRRHGHGQASSSG